LREDEPWIFVFDEMTWSFMVSFLFGVAEAKSGMRTKKAIFAALFSIVPPGFSPSRKLDAGLGPFSFRGLTNGILGSWLFSVSKP
jgi:hypothetical protein